MFEIDPELLSIYGDIVYFIFQAFTSDIHKKSFRGLLLSGKHTRYPMAINKENYLSKVVCISDHGTMVTLT